MINIKTAEELINKWYRPLNKLGDMTSIQLTEAMKEYASQFIDLAAEKATTMDDPNSYTGNTGSEYPADVIVNKQSILKIKKLIK